MVCTLSRALQRWMANGFRRQLAQAQYQFGGGLGDAGRVPVRLCCCQSSSFQAQLGSGRGRSLGRAVGTIVSDGEGALVFPERSLAVMV